MEVNYADIVYLDFSKAFDTVSHYHLQVKMKNLDISEKRKSILLDILRDMKVKIGKNYSEIQNIHSSVPQESVVGPFLFLIFINDLSNVIKSELKIFANGVKRFIILLS